MQYVTRFRPLVNVMKDECIYHVGRSYSSRKSLCLVDVLPRQSPIVAQNREMSGHNKWSNIKHIKEAKDSQKSAYATKLLHRMKVAIQEGGGADPKYNSRLASIIEEGLKNKVAKSTMENVLKSHTKSTSSGQQIFVELMGPGNCFLVVEAFTHKPVAYRQEISHHIKKYRTRIGNSGFATHAFDFKGLLHIAVKGDEGVDPDAAMEIAITVGAEDVEETTNDDDKAVLQFVCDPKDLHRVKKNLDDAGEEVLSARLAYVPNNLVKVSEDDLQLTNKLIETLEELESTVRVYDNVDVESSQS